MMTNGSIPCREWHCGMWEGNINNAPETAIVRRIVDMESETDSGLTIKKSYISELTTQKKLSEHLNLWGRSLRKAGQNVIIYCHWTLLYMSSEGQVIGSGKAYESADIDGHSGDIVYVV